MKSEKGLTAGCGRREKREGIITAGNKKARMEEAGLG